MQKRHCSHSGVFYCFLILLKKCQNPLQAHISKTDDNGNDERNAHDCLFFYFTACPYGMEYGISLFIL